MILSIGQLAAATGVKVPTIRYYEQIQLLPEGGRNRANRRQYGDAAVHQLVFIRTARELGFEVEAIRDVLRAVAGRFGPSPDSAGVINAHLEAVRQKIEKLEKLESLLSDAVESTQGMEAAAEPLF